MAAPSKDSTAPRMIGAKPVGVTDKVARAAALEVAKAFARSGRKVRLKSMHFLSSSRVRLDHGGFQVVANTVVEETRRDLRPRRSEAIDSVITVGMNRGGQVLEGVKIPSLTHAAG